MSKQATGESLNRIEEEVQRFWQLRALHLADQQEPQAESPDSGPYLISHQPLRAAGQSLADQIRLLSTVDLLVRYRTMRGSAVQRLSGWACHGMALETLVERLLPSEGTAPGIADFNAACRQVAEDGIREGQALAQRLGVWSAGEESYRTMDALPIGRVWGALRQLWEEGRLRSERRVVPVCTRCGTPLSESEAVRHLAEAPVQDGYQAWVRLPWDGQAGTYLLIWTPQPWMLLGMVAVAAHPDASYVLVEAAPATSRQRSARQAGREGASPSRLLVAETALRRLEGDYRVVGGLPSRSLRGTRYRPLFTLSLGDQMPLATREGLHRVVMSADLPLDEGTGFQPVTPSFHAGSLALAQTHELPIPEILDEWGNLDDSFARWRGITPLEAEPLVVDDLDSRGLLVRTQVEARPGRRCPYCESALLPLVQPVWLVDAGAGPWIVGRNRAWGTPLPIWSCQACGGQTCIAGLDDLAHRTGLDADRIDPHRPVVDRLVFPCDTCGGPMKRLPPVVDAAFEEAVLAGSMVPRPGPAYVAIGLGDEQTGWLAEVAQVAALLGASTSWQRVIAVPAAEAGMPWEAGRLPLADALRWATFTRTTPDEAEQGFLRPLWVLAAEWLSAPRGGEGEPGQLGAGQILLERWVQARLHQAIGAISRALDGCDPTGAAQELTGLVDDLCGWYLPLRAAEPRPYSEDGGLTVLQIVTRLLVPFVPHIAEAIHRRVSPRLGGRSAVVRGEADSVQLARWPIPRPEWADPPILERMASVRALAALGLAARTQASLEAGRRLARAQVARLPGNERKLEELALLADLLVRALNVEELEFAPEAMARVTWRIGLDRDQAASRGVTPDEIELALGGLDPAAALDLATQIWAGLSVRIEAAGRPFTLIPPEITVAAEGRQGWAAAAGGGYLVVLEAE